MQRTAAIIQRVRKLKGLTQKDVADALGLSPSTVYRIEADQWGDDIDNVIRVAEKLELKFDWTTKEVIAPPDMTPAAIEQTIERWKANRRDGNGSNDADSGVIDMNTRPVRAKFYKLPVYRMLPASHLGGPEDMYTVPQAPDEYRDAPAPSPECAVIQIDGECMAPDYPHGCYVMVDFSRAVSEGLIPNAAYYVQLRGDGEGKATFKRYVGPEGDAEIFDCINKEMFPQKIALRGLFNVARAVVKMAWMA